MTRKYDATGQLVSTERTVVEEKKLPNGAVIHATVYRSDLNGQMAGKPSAAPLNPKRRVPPSTTDVTVSRPGMSGSFDVAEKRNIVTNGDGKTVHETEMVHVPAANGQLMEAAREVRDQSTVDGNHHLHCDALRTRLHRQDESVQPAGGHHQEELPTVSLVTQVDLYAPAAYGIARERDAHAEAEGAGSDRAPAKRTAWLRKPPPSAGLRLQDPNRLGPAAPVSELVCTGKCDGPSTSL